MSTEYLDYKRFHDQDSIISCPKRIHYYLLAVSKPPTRTIYFFFLFMEQLKEEKNYICTYKSHFLKLNEVLKLEFTYLCMKFKFIKIMISFFFPREITKKFLSRKQQYPSNSNAYIIISFSSLYNKPAVCSLKILQRPTLLSSSLFTLTCIFVAYKSCFTNDNMIEILIIINYIPFVLYEQYFVCEQYFV